MSEPVKTVLRTKPCSSGIGPDGPGSGRSARTPVVVSAASDRCRDGGPCEASLVLRSSCFPKGLSPVFGPDESFRVRRWAVRFGPYRSVVTMAGQSGRSADDRLPGLGRHQVEEYGGIAGEPCCNKGSGMRGGVDMSGAFPRGLGLAARIDNDTQKTQTARKAHLGDKTSIPCADFHVLSRPNAVRF